MRGKYVVYRSYRHAEKKIAENGGLRNPASWQHQAHSLANGGGKCFFA
jgi:hypothetical protein